MNNLPDPGPILRTATAFWASKVLLTAVELDLFSTLGDGCQSAGEVERRLGLHPRATLDFLDALHALGFLEREGDGSQVRYRNTAATRVLLDKSSPHFMGGFLLMLNDRLYRFWGRLGAALQTGQPQTEVRDRGQSAFEELYKDSARLSQFLEAMGAFQAANFQCLAEQFDFSPFRSVVDMGGALGNLSEALALRHPHLKLISVDLPAVTPLARERVEKLGLSDRIDVVSGDFFTDDFPQGDAVIMGNILHDWNLEKKKVLIRKAHAALPPGGVLIVVEELIDDARRENAMGLLMSLNMLIEFGDGFNFSSADFREWCTEAGFQRFATIPLVGPTSAAVAYK